MNYYTIAGSSSVHQHFPFIPKAKHNETYDYCILTKWDRLADPCLDSNPMFNAHMIHANDPLEVSLYLETAYNELHGQVEYTLQELLDATKILHSTRQGETRYLLIIARLQSSVDNDADREQSHQFCGATGNGDSRSKRS
jgi:hypothetical protein